MTQHVCVFAALEKKMAGRQGREELIKKGLLEMMERGKCAHHPAARRWARRPVEGGAATQGARCPDAGAGPQGGLRGGRAPSAPS